MIDHDRHVRLTIQGDTVTSVSAPVTTELERLILAARPVRTDIGGRIIVRDALKDVTRDEVAYVRAILTALRDPSDTVAIAMWGEICSRHWTAVDAPVLARKVFAAAIDHILEGK